MSDLASRVRLKVVSHLLSIDEITIGLRFEPPGSITNKDQLVYLRLKEEEALRDYPIGRVFLLAPNEASR